MKLAVIKQNHGYKTSIMPYNLSLSLVEFLFGQILVCPSAARFSGFVCVCVCGNLVHIEIKFTIEIKISTAHGTHALFYFYHNITRHIMSCNEFVSLFGVVVRRFFFWSDAREIVSSFDGAENVLTDTR